MNDRIRARIAELTASRQRIAERLGELRQEIEASNAQLIAHNGAIAELEALLTEPEAVELPPEPAKNRYIGAAS